MSPSGSCEHIPRQHSIRSMTAGVGGAPLACSINREDG